jgi:hypothetical protein
MKQIKLIFPAAVAIIVMACNSTKKSSASTVSATPAAVPANTVTSVGTTTVASYGVFSVAKSPDGIYAPGNEELIAIQTQYKEVTMEKLKEGHALYTFGACARCHRAQSIYKHDVVKWKDIIDDMALKANISSGEKDAVYKYVLAIKATQAK